MTDKIENNITFMKGMGYSGMLIDNIENGATDARHLELEEIQALRANVSALEKAIKELQEENRILLLQLHRSEGDLHSFLSGRTALGAGIKARKKNSGKSKLSIFFRILLLKMLKSMSAVVRKIVNPKNALVWALTAPIRNLSRPARIKLARFVRWGSASTKL
ncbi:hypothetical protein [Microbulbifer discodermiae]|uniref:hypothetical protein n=1 Tax=Microbulbifer sp. 2201CG32-9 TaxID=3232309 RepID=UPI00345B660F